jgi:predicted nucleotidyltransferase
MVEANFRDILSVLAKNEVRFIVVGGVAAAAHGLARTTYDLDVVYARDVENVQCLVKALSGQEPYLRDTPRGLPFHWDTATIRAGLNFTLTTKLGSLDLLGEVAGGGTYEQLLPFSTELEVFGVKCRFVTLERLIQLKRAAGRPRDLPIIAELQALLEERRRPRNASKGQGSRE